MEEPAAAANTHITFDQTPSTEFYMCSNLTCRTHVVFLDNFLYKDRKLQGINCVNPVNVTAPNDERYWTAFEGHDAVEVYCNGCNRSLGYKFLWTNSRSDSVHHFLFLDRLLYWNGNQVVYAETDKPIENN